MCVWSCLWMNICWKRGHRKWPCNAPDSHHKHTHTHTDIYSFSNVVNCLTSPFNAWYDNLCWKMKILHQFCQSDFLEPRFWLWGMSLSLVFHLFELDTHPRQRTIVYIYIYVLLIQLVKFPADRYTTLDASGIDRVLATERHCIDYPI